jgi:serine/threonine-protein kinase
MVAIELASGTVIGARYRLERLLGEGGMGAVWAAEDIATGRCCALKLMKDPAGDPEARTRFLREGRAASAVHHPNVVGILEVLEPEGEPPAIAMELLEGESLRAMLGRQRKLSLAELTRIMVPVTSAVGAAHALGIVHRDLKPENIFLVRGFEVASAYAPKSLSKMPCTDRNRLIPSAYDTGRTVPRTTSRSNPDSTPMTSELCFCTKEFTAFLSVADGSW